MARLQGTSIRPEWTTRDRAEPGCKCVTLMYGTMVL
jgi:hypothetical protein